MRAALETAIVSALAFLYLYYVQFLTEHVLGTDVYFHIKLAAIYVQEGTVDGFPWATASTWENNFFDKDWLYHWALGLFTVGAETPEDLLRGAKWAAVAFGTALVGSFHAVLKLRSVRFSAVFALLLLFCGHFFLWRLGLSRPHVVSMLLSVWGLYFVLEERPVPTFVVGVLYALAYTAPHVLVGYAIIHYVVHRFTAPRGPQLVLASLGGMTLGTVLHPHRVEALSHWRTQLFDVLSTAWGGRGELRAAMRLGGELSPAPPLSYIVECSPLIILLTVAAALFWLRRKELKPCWGSLGTSAIVAAVWLVMSLSSKRFLEYAVPMGVWWAAEMITSAWRPLPLNKNQQRAIFAALGALTAVIVVRSHYAVVTEFSRPEPSIAREPAEWLAEHTSRGNIVYTCDWDDAAELFFFNHSNRYLVFGDPMFMYRRDPELWRLWVKVGKGQVKDPVQEVIDSFGAYHVYCTSDWSRMRRKLHVEPRATKIMHDRKRYLYSLVPSPPQ